MKISKSDYNKLCKIARMLNDEESDYDTFDIWEDLNEIIDNIKEEK